MNEASKLKEEYEEKLKSLQETCLHTDLTDWIEEWWAVGHSTGRTIQVCQRCDKVVKVKKYCWTCRKEFLLEDLTEIGFGEYCAGCTLAEQYVRCKAGVEVKQKKFTYKPSDLYDENGKLRDEPIGPGIYPTSCSQQLDADQMQPMQP